MKTNSLLILGFAWTLISCNGNGPDLVPERRSNGQGSEGFCNRDDNDGSILKVRVRNQGNEDVLSPFTTVVVFTPGGPKSVTTPPMPAGSFSDVQVQIPSGCFNPDCDFTITVDANSDISESNENNNSEDGHCIG